MKFKIDENLPVEFVGLLVAASHDAVAVEAQHLQSKEDSAVLEACIREGLILVTLDMDFTDIRAYPPSRYPGLIVLRLAHQDRMHLIEVSQRAIPVLKREPINRRLWIIEETRIRIRGEEK